MYAYVNVPVASAVRAGSSVSGIVPIEVTAEALAAMPSEDRDLLAGYAGLATGTTPPQYTHQLIDLPTPALGGLLAALRDAAARRAASAAAEAARQAERNANWLDRARQVVSERRERADDRWPDVRTPAWPYVGGIDEATIDAARAWPETVAWLADLETANAQRAAETRARKEARYAEQVARRAAEVEADHRYCAAREALVRQIGTADQIGRLDDGLLPDEEADGLVYDHVFAPLADVARYVKLTVADLSHAEGCAADEYDVQATFGAEDAAGVSGAEWTRLVAIRAALPEAEVTPREHVATCETCEEQTRRASARVAIQWHGRTLVREYAI
jgi:hypothetical protein